MFKKIDISANALCCYPKRRRGTILGYKKETEHLPAKIFQLGLLPGIEFRILYQAPFSGPLMIEYGKEKSRVALRVDEAEMILVAEK